TLIWDSIPTQLARENKKFMFSHVRSGARAKDLEDALEWLIDAGLVHKTKRVDPPKVPLSIYADNASFKIYMADLGILRKMARLRPDFMFSKDKDMDLFRGMAAENYVHNEVLRSAEGPLYYWRSDGKAEVDIIAQIEGVAVPIEVKAGNSPSKSLSEYIRKYSPPIAVKASMATGGNGVVCNIPIYAIWKVRDHIHRSMRSGTDTQ
ncbi:MAG: DUF4143 domain-containing protein, partial [Candidatus Methanoplasma sp.]|nr:DUF4143 domain-containing protein [Candidatus Methanoplasma sp.]